MDLGGGEGGEMYTSIFDKVPRTLQGRISDMH